MLSLDQAIEKMQGLKREFYFSRDSETVLLSKSLGRELSEAILAEYMSPEFDIAAMDGYALRARDKYPLSIIGRAYAGDNRIEIRRGGAAAVATGAILPRGADSVLKMEDAELKNELLYGVPLKKWSNVFRAGSDYRAGDIIFEKNHRIMPQSIALLYSLGVEKVRVYKKIRVGIISTGTEIHNGMIKNTNAVLIRSFMEEFGCESYFVGTVPDDYERTREMLLEATKNYDIIFTTGGVSVGERDFVADIIKEAGKLLFHGVRIRPGKPLAVGIVRDRPVFALPGKPTGAFAATEMVVRRYFTYAPRPSREVKMNEEILLEDDDFDYILFVKIVEERANPVGYRSSGLKLLSTKSYETSAISASPRSTIVDGYAITNKNIKKGEVVKVHLFS